MALDIGVGTEVPSFFSQPHLLCSGTLGACPGRAQGPRRKRFHCRGGGPASAVSPHNRYHVSVQRLGLRPAPIPGASLSAGGREAPGESLPVAWMGTGSLSSA